MTADDRVDRDEAATGEADRTDPAAETTEEPPADAEPAALDETVEAAVERVTGTTAALSEAGIDESTTDRAAGAKSDATVDDTTAATSVDDTATPPSPGDPPARDAGYAAAEATTRVLEFALGDERFCIDIEYVEEIVNDKSVTRVPNTPAHVEGVVDLRGQITTVLDPTVLIGVEETTTGGLLVVFDEELFEDGSTLGWVVDDVRQVMPVTDRDVTEAPVDAAHVNGVIDRDDGDFVVWTSPVAALEAAT